jgi:DNA-binding NtrC family response regulator
VAEEAWTVLSKVRIFQKSPRLLLKHVKTGGPVNANATETFAQEMVTVSAPLRRIELIIEAGPQAGTVLTLDDGIPNRLYLGRSDLCDIPLGDRQASRRHAAIDVVDGQLKVVDLDSTNGTFIDTVRITEAFWKEGQFLRIGETVIGRRGAPVSAAPPPLDGRTSFGRTRGSSREMRRLYTLCEKFSQSRVSLLIEGETGTGKEVLAESIHEEGPRQKGPFVVFDCTTVAPNLVESELFGHERGAFTGATSQKVGVFEQANGGTLLIDEIGDLDLTLQPKLLRVLERSEFRRVGGTQMKKADVRVLCATRRDLEKEVHAGRFRDDLYHRIAVTRIELPPLRRRRGDVPALAMHFAEVNGYNPKLLSSDVLSKWDKHSWPGNIRELRNAVIRHFEVGDEGLAEEAFIPAGPATAADANQNDIIAWVLARGLPVAAARKAVLDELERRYLEKVLAECNGDVAKAVQRSGIERRQFNRLRAKFRDGDHR